MLVHRLRHRTNINPPSAQRLVFALVFCVPAFNGGSFIMSHLLSLSVGPHAWLLYYNTSVVIRTIQPRLPLQLCWWDDLYNEPSTFIKNLKGVKPAEALSKIKICHPSCWVLYGMNSYVLIWGDWLSCDPLRGSHDSQSPHIKTLVPHLVATLIYLSQIYSYYIRGDRSPLI